MHVLAFVMIPLLIGPFLWDLSAEEEATFAALDIFIWVVFASVLGLKTIVAPQGLHYLRQHWLEVLIVIVPFFRPLRILRILLLGTRTFIGFRRAVHVDYLRDGGPIRGAGCAGGQHYNIPRRPLVGDGNSYHCGLRRRSPGDGGRQRCRICAYVGRHRISVGDYRQLGVLLCNPQPDP